MGRVLTLHDVEAAVRGGAVFACGGGGWIEHGRELGTLAVTIGRPQLVSIDELAEDDLVATAAAIGAPGGSTDWQMLGVDYVRAVQMVQEDIEAPIAGLIIGQNGMSSTVNAWLPSALLGLKVVDAVGDMRAHPTGDMGSLGLAANPDAVVQAVAGGNRGRNQYLEALVRGPTATISPILRTAADRAGGFIASCRNPVRASYVRAQAALGGISRALALGDAILAAEARGGAAVTDAICRATGGQIIGSGRVARSTVRYTREAYDVGIIEIDAVDRRVLHVMNEYMAVDGEDGARLATYPDVITTLDADGHPVSAGALTKGQEVLILHVPKSLLPLARSVRDPVLYQPVEQALGIEITRLALAGLES